MRSAHSADRVTHLSRSCETTMKNMKLLLAAVISAMVLMNANCLHLSKTPARISYLPISWIPASSPIHKQLAPKRQFAEDEDVKEVSFVYEFEGKTFLQTLTANPSDFVATYNVKETDTGLETTMVDEYQTKLRIFHPSGLNACIVTRFTPERTFKSGKEFAEWKASANRQMQAVKFSFDIDGNEPPYYDPENLSEEAQNACAGLPVYQRDMEDDSENGNDSNEKGGRKKRGWKTWAHVAIIVIHVALILL